MKDVTIVPDDFIITHRKLDYIINCSNNDEIVYAVERTYRTLVLCKECKHRPIKDDPDGADYGFNIVEPTDGDDLCPCLVEDGWYSWMPEDNFYCGRGERK